MAQRFIKKRFIKISLAAALLCGSFMGCQQAAKSNDYLLMFNDASGDQYGYKDEKGEAVIPLGKYAACFTDTFRTYAVVLNAQQEFVAIDRKETVLYKVFPFDNGPDYASNGLFRIVENTKIGFADAATGKIMIKPQFSCAFPFENGVAKVSNDCKAEPEGEHTSWTSENWYYINTSGEKVDAPAAHE